MSTHPLAGSRELVLASAGSGKTFRISSRIIGLLAAGEPPAAVFASTFTRKAAGEILERVLIRLARAAGDPEEAAALARHSEVPPDTDPPPAFWTRVLAETVRRLHELDIGTLDAFFGRALRSFAHEAGLPPGWRVADEPTQARLRARALERVLAGADPGIVIELVRGVRGVDAARSVHEALLREVGDVVRVHRELAPGAPGWLALGEALALDDLDAESLSRQAHALADEVATLELPTTNAGSPRAHWVNAQARIRTALTAQEWGEALGETLIERALAGEKYSGAECDAAWQDFARRLARLGVQALGAQIQARAAAMGRLGERYADAYDRAVFDEGALAFDDVVRLLTPGGTLARPELGYRLDGRLRHLLLDEFQDTSLLQWRALLPLADALVGPDAPPEGSASVVADPKQSIYGWRGAAPVIVDALEERYPLETEQLAVSWRSSPRVLEVVNWTFTDIAASEVFRASSSGGAAAETNEAIDRETAAAWAEHFQEHRAAPREDGSVLPGHVRFVVGPEREDQKSFQPKLLAFAADEVAALHRRAPGRSIGVLVRTHTAVARLIYELRRRGVPASEEGGTPLVDDPGVVSVLALLRLADHPGDALAAYHVARTPLGRVLEGALELPGNLTDETDAAAVARTAAGVRRRLVHDGYGPTLGRLRDALLPHIDARGEGRLGQLVELGYRHDERPTLRSDDFVALAESTRVESAGDDPVRVMTVWGSKGLEFDAVVLPHLHDTLVSGGPGAGPPLVHRPTPTERVTHAFPPVSGTLRTLLEPRVPELAHAYAAQRAALVRDALSVLYVAMTRARYALHLIIPADGEKVSRARSAAALLRERLSQDPDRPTSEGEVLLNHGDPAWMDALPDVPALAPDAPTDTGIDTLELTPPPRARRHLSRRTPSGHGAGSRTADELLGDLVPTGHDDATRDAPPPTVKGSVVHAWLEHVTWLGSDAAAPPQLPSALTTPASRLALARHAAPTIPTALLTPWSDEVWDALQPQLTAPGLRERLDEGAMRGTLADLAATGTPSFAGDAAALTLEVRAEVRFVMREREGLVEGVIDRLVLARTGSGDVVAAHILDWKTDAVLADGAAGRVDEARLEERVEIYRSQLGDYRDAVVRLFGVRPEAVRCELAFLEVGRVVGV